VTRALAAHMRLLEQPLPRRTHYRHYAEEPNQGRRYGDTLPQVLIDEYKRLKAGGMGYTDVLQTMSIGSRTYRRLEKHVARRAMTITISTYTVRIVDAGNPYFPRYQIFKLGKLIGTQRSMPTLSDCEWHAAGGVYATIRAGPMPMPPHERAVRKTRICAASRSRAAAGPPMPSACENSPTPKPQNLSTNSNKWHRNSAS
jgi:hypothetical protein